jgi:uncharacterized heparinase superfamily protein
VSRSRLLGQLRRGLRKPPHVVARRLAREARAVGERYAAPRRARRLGEQRLLRMHGAGSIDELWQRLAERPYVAATRIDRSELEGVCTGEGARVAELARRALRREVDLLGSGPTTLPTPIDWHVDFKTGISWPLAWARSIEYTNLDRPSDVKVPWELSRLHWLLPAGQAYLLEPDEALAGAARTVLEEWLDANPYGSGVNWAVAMESALRILSWTWLFHAFARSEAWRDRGFRFRLLTALHLHADWTARHIERSDVNGNHYSADAAGLAFAGLFFDHDGWAGRGWRILEQELPRQVTPDGVDFEGSLAYHRLVCELFLLPALYRERLGLGVPAPYRERVRAMALVAAHATRDDGTTPLLGDADDARALPLGGQALGDHRYLAGIVAAAWDDDELRDAFSGSRSEVAWLLGVQAARSLPQRDRSPLGSAAFPDGGLYVLRGGGDHILVDCGPVGLAGRGGHGHDDCLSLEAVLAGVHLLSDCGSYVYTASAEWRDRFRSTAFHNTPRVDGEEQNRFTVPASLWSLTYDARPHVAEWTATAQVDRLRAGHSGYLRLPRPVALERSIELDRGAHRLTIADTFTGDGGHRVEVPFHLAVGVTAMETERGRWLLAAAGVAFSFTVESSGWQALLRPTWISPSYGVKHESSCIELFREGALADLTVVIEPAEAA